MREGEDEAVKVKRVVAVAAMVVAVLGISASSARATPAWGTYEWPVVGPVINGFLQPASPYGSGHRGIDIAVPIGSPVRAAASGVVAFAGSVGGSLFVSIDHPDGVRTTYSWLSSIAVRRGDRVAAGEEIGTSGHGHPQIPLDHLHFGARVGDTYLDPLLLLGRPDLSALIRLAPLDGKA